MQQDLISLGHFYLPDAHTAILDITTEGRYWRTSKLVALDVIVADQGDASLKADTPGAQIGSAFTVRLEHFLAEREADEYDMLLALPELLRKYQVETVITFNGTSFDIPHLEKKYQAYRVKNPLEGLHFRDLYLEYRDVAEMFGMASRRLVDYLDLACKEPTEPMRITPADLTGGGPADLTDGGPADLMCEQPEDAANDNQAAFAVEKQIPLDTDAVRTLLILDKFDTFRSFLDGRFSLGHAELNDYGLSVTLHADKPMHLPAIKDGPFSLSWNPDGSALFCADVENGTLCRFYTDFDNYEFLPQEGYAIHKSLSHYVAKDRKAKATRDNCFIRVPAGASLLENENTLRKYVLAAFAWMRTK